MFVTIINKWICVRKNAAECEEYCNILIHFDPKFSTNYPLGIASTHENQN